MKLALRRFLRSFVVFGGIMAIIAIPGEADIGTKVIAVVLCGLGIAAAATLLAWFYDQGLNQSDRKDDPPD
jgi:hypothetical protein